MKLKKAIKLFIILSLICILIYVFVGLKRKTPSDYKSELESDGEKMVHSTYDNKNKRAMELKCNEATKKPDDKLEMKDIEGIIFKKGRMNKDIKVFGKKGYVANNAHNFYIEDDARIVSEDFTIKSLNFFLKDQAILSTKKKVLYQTKDLEGAAIRGMEY